MTTRLIILAMLSALIVLNACVTIGMPKDHEKLPPNRHYF